MCNIVALTVSTLTHTSQHLTKYVKRTFANCLIRSLKRKDRPMTGAKNVELSHNLDVNLSQFPTDVYDERDKRIIKSRKSCFPSFLSLSLVVKIVIKFLSV